MRVPHDLTNKVAETHQTKQHQFATPHSLCPGAKPTHGSGLLTATRYLHGSIQLATPAASRLPIASRWPACCPNEGRWRFAGPTWATWRAPPPTRRHSRATQWSVHRMWVLHPRPGASTPIGLRCRPAARPQPIVGTDLKRGRLVSLPSCRLRDPFA